MKCTGNCNQGRWPCTNPRDCARADHWEDYAIVVLAAVTFIAIALGVL